MGVAEGLEHLPGDRDGLLHRHLGGLVRLEQEELAWIGMDDKDPKKAVGIYVVNHVDCDLGTLVEWIGRLETAGRHKDQCGDRRHRDQAVFRVVVVLERPIINEVAVKVVLQLITGH